MDKVGRGYCTGKGAYDANATNNFALIIKLPDSRALRILSRSFLFAIVLIALPSLFSIMRAATSGAFLYKPDSKSDAPNNFDILPVLLRNLHNEGLIKKGDQGFILGATSGDINDDFDFLKDAGIHLQADLQQKNVVEEKVFDFVYTTCFKGIQVVDSILKESGLVVSPLGHDPSNRLRLLNSYKIVYLRRFDSAVVAMRKRGQSSSSSSNSAMDEVVPLEDKRTALKGLEDVDLEPPKRAMLEKKLSFMSRKIKFLPDLMRDSLDEYPRRVFISDDSSAINWFYNNYPMRHQEFEVMNMEGSNYGSSAWLRKNARQEEYVVMKAEARVVEEMLKDQTLFLVDELFLGCKNQWQDGEEENESKRAYWLCLALYGKVRDEGIAVHQWWG